MGKLNPVSLGTLSFMKYQSQGLPTASASLSHLLLPSYLLIFPPMPILGSPASWLSYHT